MGHKASSRFARAAVVPMGQAEVDQALAENELSLVVELARKRTAISVQTLEKCMKSDSASWASRIAAAKTMLEFAHGKPGQDQRAPAGDASGAPVQVQIVLLGGGEKAIDVTDRLMRPQIPTEAPP